MPVCGHRHWRLLADVEALRRHVPQWLRQSSDMSETKLAGYHSDAARAAASAKSVHDAQYMKARRTGTSLGWRLHRLRLQVQGRMMEMS